MSRASDMAQAAAEARPESLSGIQGPGVSAAPAVRVLRDR